MTHRQEHDGRVRDRIKAVLLYDDDWTPPKIAKVLLEHLELETYLKIKNIQIYVAETFQKHLGISTLYDWLKSHGFSYKKPKLVPKNVDPVKQKAFIDFYENLMNEASLTEDPVLFGDSVHLSQQTRPSYGWIK